MHSTQLLLGVYSLLVVVLGLFVRLEYRRWRGRWRQHSAAVAIVAEGACLRPWESGDGIEALRCVFRLQLSRPISSDL